VIKYIINSHILSLLAIILASSSSSSFSTLIKQSYNNLKADHGIPTNYHTQPKAYPKINPSQPTIKMNASALISAIVVALASYAAAAPVPQDGGAGNETVGFNFPRPIHTFSSIGRT
jgi:hypothetical protein